MSIAVYTAIFGAYDALKPVGWDGAQFVCFTDRYVKIDGWVVVRIARQFYDPRREARMYKALSHQWVDAEYSIWQDGHGELKVSPVEFVEMLGGYDIAVFAHPHHECAYDEARELIETGKAPRAAIYGQARKYLDGKYPHDNGLAATGLVVRRHTPDVVRFNDAWWSEITRHTNRDQLSFNYVAWLLGMEYEVIPGDLWDNEFVAWGEHLR